MSDERIDVYYGRIAAANSERRASNVVAPAARVDASQKGPVWNLLSRLISDALGVDSESLRFDTGPNGKPYIVAPKEPTLWFNISHTTDRYCIAISKSVQVGVDVERIRGDRDYPAMAKYAFTPEEARAIGNLPQEDIPTKFVTLWVRKEAIIKSIGGSSARLLDAFSVPSDVNRCRFTVDAAKRTIAVRDLPAGIKHRVSVAWEGSEGIPIRYRKTDTLVFG